MSESSKKVNYTEGQTLQLVSAYESETTDEGREDVVKEMAENLGKTVRSVRQKLVREGVYVKKENKTKAGTSIERKATIVTDIAETLGIESSVIESLEKATKPTLELIRAEFMAAKAVIAGENQKPDSE